MNCCVDLNKEFKTVDLNVKKIYKNKYQFRERFVLKIPIYYTFDVHILSACFFNELKYYE